MIAKDAYIFLVPLLVVALLPLLAGWWVLSSVLMIFPLFVAYFFRNPERKIEDDDKTVLSPADGRIVSIDENEEQKRVSIFMNVFNVHINRFPIAGKITFVEHSSGKFMPADRERASFENERNRVVIEGNDFSVTVVQIAGLIARRICFWFNVGDSIEQGQRLGLIKFGSRVDIYFPATMEVAVTVGDKVKGGLSVIAKRGQ